MVFSMHKVFFSCMELTAKYFAIIVLVEERKNIASIQLKLRSLLFLCIGKCLRSTTDLPSLFSDVRNPWKSEKSLAGPGTLSPERGMMMKRIDIRMLIPGKV